MESTNRNCWVTLPPTNKGTDIFIVIFRLSNMVVNLWGPDHCSLVLGYLNHLIFAGRLQPLFNVTDSSLAPFNLSELFGESFTVCSVVSCFGITVFKFTLIFKIQKTLAQPCVPKKSLTGSVE
jgi:hypothetical protein